MSALIKVHHIVPTPTSPSQKSFKKLSRKLQELQEETQKISHKLDKWLSFYFHQVMPEQKALASILIEQVKILYAFYQNKELVSRKERNHLKEIILDKLAGIARFLSIYEAGPEIEQIYKDLSGACNKDTDTKDFEDFKTETKEFFETKGIDIDLSNMEMTDDLDDVMRKIFESLGEENMEKFQKQKEPPPQAKSKKQLERERQKAELKELQNKSFKSLYKQLARYLHPDLEQDPVQKAEKAKLMQDLTSAYDRNDLFALLALERKYLKHQKNAYSDEQLKIFNSLLQSQIQEVKASQHQLLFEPKYAALRSFIDSPLFCNGMQVLIEVQHELKSKTLYLQTQIKKLQGKRAKKTIEKMIESHLYNISMRESFFEDD